MADEKRLTLDAAVLRADGWNNFWTGFGERQHDKRMGAFVRDNRLTFEGLHQLYRHDDMARRIVDRPAGDMVREWLEVRVGEETSEQKDPRTRNDARRAGDKTNAISESVNNGFDVLDAQARFEEAIRFRRVYGGAGILIGANDGSGLNQMREPLREQAIQSIDYLTVFDCRELQVVEYYDNPLAAKFGEPKIYRLMPRAVGFAGLHTLLDVHESRILRFNGWMPSRDQIVYNQGWGESDLNACNDILRDFGLSWESTASLLQDFAQAVYKIAGLADAMASDNEALILKRMKLIEMSRSVIRGVLLDADKEDFERKPTPITGLPDLLDRFCKRLASAADMPVSLIMGDAPSGLGASGDNNLRFYYDHIAWLQRRIVLPNARRLARLIMLAKSNTATKGSPPEKWQIVFRPLWQLDEVQKSTVRVNMATADNLNIQNQIVTPDEVRASRFGSDGFSVDTEIDKDGRDAYDNAENNPDVDLLDPVPPRPIPGEPPAPAPKSGGPIAAGMKTQDTALNGAQVTSALAIVQAVAEGKLPRDSAVNQIEIFFNLTPEQADKVLGSVGRGFEPKPDPTPPPKPGVPKPPEPPKPGEEPRK